MNFVGGESPEARVIGMIRAESHSVFYVHDGSAGMPDDEVLALSVRMNAPVITNDRDFGELIFRQGQASVGVIFLRFGTMPTLEKGGHLIRWLRENEHLVLGHYVVLGPRLSRVRRLE